MLLTSVTPTGRFRVGIHQPSYTVANLRQHDYLLSLGTLPDGQVAGNQANFPASDVQVAQARPIYEIRNPLPFRGCTFIDTGWAESRAAAPLSIRLPAPQPVSLRALLGQYCVESDIHRIIQQLPRSLRYDLAATSTDPQELVWLAESCCQFVRSGEGAPAGLRYQEKNGEPRAVISDFELFETIANNPHLPDVYKQIMVLRPGVQGGSEIVGDDLRRTTENPFRITRCFHCGAAGQFGDDVDEDRHRSPPGFSACDGVTYGCAGAFSVLFVAAPNPFP